MTWSIALAVELLLMYTLGRRAAARLLGWGLGGGTGRRWLTWGLLAPGTALHESSHALLVLALGGRISRFVPFRPQRDGAAVQLGFVEHSAVRGGPLGGALVGLAPLVGVPLVCWLAGLVLVPGGGSPAELAARAATLPSGWLWLVLAGILSLGALPSPSDHRDLPLALVAVGAALAAAAALGVLPSAAALAPLTAWLAGLLAVPALTGLVLGVWPAAR